MATVDMSNLEPLDQSGVVESGTENGAWSDPDGPEIARIRRIGKRLFGVANCVVAWSGQTADVAIGAGRSMAAIEAEFCAQLTPQTLRAVADTRADAALAVHRLVVGAPYIRFFAACPIFNESGLAVGSLSLIDYSPRLFGSEERQLLADLAAQVERELRLQASSVEQLDLLKKNKNLRRDSLLDPLVGTWNRAAIVRLVTIEKERCSKNQQPLSLILAGIDHFKRVNETLGQSVCDTILIKIASRVRSCIRPGDALGRYIGDQMLVVLPGASHIAADSVAERMRRAVMQPPAVADDASVSLTLSAGMVSTNLFPLASADELIRHADLALHAAKEAGRNGVVQAKPASI